MQTKKPNRKVLLIDDDADDRKYFTEAIMEIDAGIECVTAKEGEQALAMLRHNDFSLPDFIFLDLRMPRINGRQCLMQIKADQRLKNIPVIIYTTSKEVYEAEAMQNLGSVHFITKPSDPDEIYFVLSQVLQEPWSDDAWMKNKV